jgi:hypothetical protein
MTNKEKSDQNEGFEVFLTDSDQTEEGVEYIQPDIELKLPKEKRMECRQIVQEIKKFGITSQRQLMYLIYLLALEIEEPNTVKAITAAVKVGRKELGEEKKLII